MLIRTAAVIWGLPRPRLRVSACPTAANNSQAQTNFHYSAPTAAPVCPSVFGDPLTDNLWTPTSVPAYWELSHRSLHNTQGLS